MDAYALAETIGSANAVAVSNLAAAINAAHGATNGLFRQMCVNGGEVGRLLLKAQASMPAIQWKPWCKANIRIGERMIQNYIRLARYGVPDEATAELGIMKAVKLLAKPRVAPAADENAEDMHEEKRCGRAQPIETPEAYAQAVPQDQVVLRILQLWNRLDFTSKQMLTERFTSGKVDALTFLAA